MTYSRGLAPFSALMKFVQANQKNVSDSYPEPSKYERQKFALEPKYKSSFLLEDISSASHSKTTINFDPVIDDLFTAFQLTRHLNAYWGSIRNKKL